MTMGELGKLLRYRKGRKCIRYWGLGNCWLFYSESQPKSSAGWSYDIVGDIGW